MKNDLTRGLEAMAELHAEHEAQDRAGEWADAKAAAFVAEETHFSDQRDLPNAMTDLMLAQVYGTREETCQANRRLDALERQIGGQLVRGELRYNEEATR